VTRLEVLSFMTLEVPSSSGFIKFGKVERNYCEAPQLVSEVVECLIWWILVLVLALFGAPSCIALGLENRMAKFRCLGNQGSGLV
jgi:hypothetical protein